MYFFPFLLPQSFALAIVGAEYVAGLVPMGTHDWSKFVKPDEMKVMITSRGFQADAVQTCGLQYNPLSGRWMENAEALDVNYIMVAVRSEQGYDR